jgi:hypothetical protein
MTPLDQILPQAQRDELRRRGVEKGRFYNPWVHLGTTTFFGLGMIGAAVALIQDLKWWQVAFGLALLVLSNAAEWRIHRDLLHKRSKLAPVLYDRHTPQHHMIYVTDDMAVRSRKEWRLVLLPSWGIIMLFVALLPAMALFWLGWPKPLFAPVDQHNIACVFAIVTMFYVVSYEWLHLSYHLAPETFVGSLWLVRVMRRHHATHHDPRLMQKWNFNVSLPLWDWVRGTIVKQPAAAEAKAKAA